MEVRKNPGPAKMASRNSFSYICTIALHSFRFFAHCLTAFTVIPLLPKATFTPSVQPNLDLPRTRSHSSGQRYSSILSTWPNNLKTLRLALLVHCLSIPVFLCNSSFLTLSIRDTPAKHPTLHLKNVHFPSLSTSNTPCLCSVQRRW